MWFGDSPAFSPPQSPPLGGKHGNHHFGCFIRRGKWLLFIILSLIPILTSSPLVARGKPPTAERPSWANDQQQAAIFESLSSIKSRRALVGYRLSTMLRDPPLPIVFTPSTVRFARRLSTDEGAKLYRQWCSTCHGDQGQGLTEEWRAEWPEGKQNCWQSKCHAANHPPDGFSFPQKVPALIGPDTLTKFRTAQDLYVYNRSAMPYWAPNLLEDDEYRAITAFLVKANYNEQGFPSPTSLSGDWTTLSLHPETAVKETLDDEVSKVSQTQEVLPKAEVFSPATETQKSVPVASSTTGFLVWIAAIALGGGLVIWLISRFFPTANKRG